MRFFVSLVALGFFLVSLGTSEAATTWKTFDGQTFQADPVQFDFESKVVTLLNAESGARVSYHTRDLDFRSKRKLLLSPVFHRSYPKGGFWPTEKISLFAIAILSPIILLIAGMWLAGLFFAKKFNPFKALGAFLGSWIAGVILIICYLVFAAKSDMGVGLIWFGTAIAGLVMALFISSIYSTTFLKGVIIFVTHILFAALLAFLLIIGTETLLPLDEVSGFWEKWVFAKTGLVEGVSRTGY